MDHNTNISKQLSLLLALEKGYVGRPMWQELETALAQEPAQSLQFCNHEELNAANNH